MHLMIWISRRTFYLCNLFLKPKKSTMKKVFALMAITSVMVACNNAGETKETPVDSTATAAPAGAPADTTAATHATVDSTAMAMPDSATAK
jgi:uncharacterized lipoprotein NlpE involved in copper resistance